MGVYEIEVVVALRRPPRYDEYRKYLITADRPAAAELLACQWAFSDPRVVMPVASRLVTYTDRSADEEERVDQVDPLGR